MLPIVIVPNKNGKLQVSIDYQKLNAITKVDFFPLPFTWSILKVVAGHKMYTLIDGYNEYNGYNGYNGYYQIMIALKDQLK